MSLCKQVYNQQIALIKNIKYPSVSAIVYSRLLGVSKLKDVYSILLQLCVLIILTQVLHNTTHTCFNSLLPLYILPSINDKAV
jgi:hypothetical protein